MECPLKLSSNRSDENKTETKGAIDGDTFGFTVFSQLGYLHGERALDKYGTCLGGAVGSEVF
jgi:hypothetical protein